MLRMAMAMRRAASSYAALMSRMRTMPDQATRPKKAPVTISAA
jgi:hypothetical protein